MSDSPEMESRAEKMTKELDPPGAGSLCSPASTAARLALKIWVLDQPILACLHIFLPFAIVCKTTMQEEDAKSEAITFLTCLLAVVPLAERLGYATEQVGAYTGDVASGLLNASFGNVPELLVTIIAIKQGLELVAIQMLIGGVLSCLLLVTGLSAFIGGLKHKVQHYNTANSSTLISMVLIIATFAGLITMAERYGAGFDTPQQHGMPGALAASRALAVVGMIVYIMYLVYSLGTHKEMFDEKDGEHDGGDEEPELSALAAICMMGALVALISYLSDGLVDAIDGAAEHSGIPSLILCALIIPNVSNALEHAVSIQMAWKGRLDASIATSPPQTLPSPKTVNGRFGPPSMVTPSDRKASVIVDIGRIRAPSSPSKRTSASMSAAIGGTNRMTVPARPTSMRVAVRCAAGAWGWR